MTSPRSKVIGMALRRGLRKRCPHCGEGQLFAGWSHLDRCSVCGLVFEPNPGDTWALTIIGNRVPIAVMIVLIYFGVMRSRPALGLMMMAAVGLVWVWTIPNRWGAGIALNYLARVYWPDPADPLPPPCGDGSRSTQEWELKFRVDGSRAFDALAAAVGAEPTPAVRQVNHFFDTAGLSLRRTKHTLRLRDEAGALTITAKGPQQTAGGVLTRRPEEEVTIDRPAADAILRGERSPLTVITELAPPAARDLLAEMSTIVGGDALVRIGAIENERARLSASLVVDGAPIALLFEMDRTTFPGGHVDYEMEVELDDATAGAASAAVMKLLADAGIAWQPATSKAERFFDIVARSVREPSA